MGRLFVLLLLCLRWRSLVCVERDDFSEYIFKEGDGENSYRVVSPDLPLKFVVLSAPRSATTSLVGLLNSHPSVVCHKEAFHPAKPYTHFAADEVWTSEMRDVNRSKFFERLWTNDAKEEAVGFKAFPGHLTRSDFHVLLSPHVRKIVVERRDKLASYVSNLKGKKEKCFTRGCATPSTSVEVDFDDFRAFIAERDAWFRFLHELADKFDPGSWLFVDTEDLLLRNNSTTINLVYDHLNIPVPDKTTLETSDIKYQPYSSNGKDTLTYLQNFVSNFEQIQNNDLIRHYLKLLPP